MFLPGGEPAAGAQLSIVGRSRAVRLDERGAFRIEPDPQFPATLIVIGRGGEVYPPVHLANRPEGPVELTLEPVFRETVTVVSGVAPNIESTPAAATVIAGQEDLEERQPQHLVEALEGVAGVAKSEESAVAVPIIRGLSGGRTVLLLDGARVTTERRAGASGSFVDPFSLGSIEISRGAGSVAYGSDAFGGVIHAIPRDPVRGDPHVRFLFRGAIGGAPLASAGIEANFDAAGGAMLAQIHGRQASDQESGGGTPLENSSFSDGGLVLRWIRDTGSGRLRLGLSAVRSDELERPTADVERVRVVYPEEEADRLTFALDRAPGGAWTAMELRAFLGHSRLVTDRRTVATGGIERSDVEAWDSSLRLTAHRALAGGAFQIGSEIVSRFGLGAESLALAGDRVTSRESSIEDAARHDAAVFVTWDRPLGDALTASFGARGDLVRSRNAGGFFGPREIEHAALSGHAALTWRIRESVSSTLQVARGFREPTLSDRFFRGTTARGLITGNPELDPETSLQFDGSLRWTGRRATAALFAYAYEIENLVERFRAGTDFFFRNRGEADVRGIELEVTAPLPLGFELQTAATVARGESGDGTPLDEIAAPNAQATLRWAGARGFALVRLRAYAEDDRPGPLELKRPGYALLETSAGWRIRPNLELIAVLDNALDRRFFASPDESAPLAPGRTLTIALLGRF